MLYILFAELDRNQKKDLNFTEEKRNFDYKIFEAY